MGTEKIKITLEFTTGEQVEKNAIEWFDGLTEEGRKAWLVYIYAQAMQKSIGEFERQAG